MDGLKAILFATDLTPESDRALEHARFLAETFGARLTVYHAVELPRREYARWVQGREQEVWARVVEGAHRELARRVEGLKVPFEIVVDNEVSAPGLLVDLALLERIRADQPDLTVIATRGRKGFSAFFVGSVAQQVVQHAGRPVLCVRQAEHGLQLPYRRLLVCTDLSTASRAVFGTAALLAGRMAAATLALHVAPPTAAATLAGLPVDSGPAPSPEELRAFLEPEFKDLAVEARVSRGGRAWKVIVEAAADYRADIVLMTTRGHDSLSDAVVGSTADRVLRHAPCPVLVA